MKEIKKIKFVERPHDEEVREVFENNTHVRILDIGAIYSTYEQAMQVFGIKHIAELVGDDIFSSYYLNTVPKRWQMTEHIVMDCAIHMYGNAIYWIRSVDGTSDLIIAGDAIEELVDYDEECMFY